jgi:Pectate lyase superfamily protein
VNYKALLLSASVLALPIAARAQCVYPDIATTSWPCKNQPLPGNAALPTDVLLSYRASLGDTGEGLLDVAHILSALSKSQVQNAFGYIPANVAGDTFTGPVTFLAPVTFNGGGDASSLTVKPLGGVPRALGTIALDYQDVNNYGADPTGLTDSSVAINKAGGLVGSTYHCAYLPGGTYYVKFAITVPCVKGDSMFLSVVKVDQNFDPTAAGVFIAPPTIYGPNYSDFLVAFSQPNDQTSRAAFHSLAQGCSTGVGGTGCKYPPAFYDNVAGSRVDIHDIWITSSWDGFSFVGNAGAGFLSRIYVGALDVALAEDGAQDPLFITDFESWPFGMSGGTPLELQVYEDGKQVAANIGRADGISIKGFLSFYGAVNFTSNFSFGTVSQLQLDTNAFLTMAASTIPGLFIDDVYASGTAVGANTNCQFNFTGGTTRIAQIHGNGLAYPAVCVSGGVVKIGSGTLGTISTTTPAVLQTGGLLSIENTYFDPSNASAFTVPIVNSTTGRIVLVGDHFPPATFPNEVGFSITDSSWNVVADNAMNGWSFVPPGNIGNYSKIYIPPQDQTSVQEGAYNFSTLPSASNFDTAYGFGTLVHLTLGTSDSAFGASAGESLTTGVHNSFFGNNAGLLDVAGNNNSCFGFAACQSMTGSQATAYGEGALLHAIGNYNNGFGYLSGASVTSGSDNLILGPQVGSSILTIGNNNIFLGTGPSVDALTPATSFEVNIANMVFYNASNTGAPNVTNCGTGSAVDAHANNRSGTISAGTGAVASCSMNFAGTGYSVWNHCRAYSQLPEANFGYSYTLTTLTVTATSLASDSIEYDCDGY